MGRSLNNRRLSRRAAPPYHTSETLQNPDTWFRTLLPPHCEIDTGSEAEAGRRRTWLSSKCARPFWPSVFAWIVVWAVLDLGFGITFSSIARYIVPPLVLLGLVISILDYRSDG